MALIDFFTHFLKLAFGYLIRFTDYLFRPQYRQPETSVS